MGRSADKARVNAAVADALAEMRRAAGLSQESLAFECGLHPTYISKIERGLKTPTVYTVIQLAQALGCKPHQLMRKVEKYL